MTQKKRKQKVSKGENKMSSNPQDPQDLVRMGKGRAASIKEVPMERAWRGVGIVKEPYDAKQALENKRLYPHLFMDERR